MAGTLMAGTLERHNRIDKSTDRLEATYGTMRQKRPDRLTGRLPEGFSIEAAAHSR